MMSRIHLVFLAMLVAAGFVIGGVAYPTLPNPVPIHWSINGQPNGYGPPWIDALLVPAVAAVLAGLLVLIPMFRFGGDNLHRFSRAYGRVAIVVIGMLLAIECLILLKATNHQVRIERVLPLIVGIGIAFLGNWMGKIRRNHIMGIRTPWTLSSDLVWERTHRIGGRLMVVYGLAAAVAGLFAPPVVALSVILGGAVALTAWAMVYSCMTFRKVS